MIIITLAFMIPCNYMQKQLADICVIIKQQSQRPRPQRLPSFFWKHFVSNLHELENVLSLTFDDVVLLLHLIIKKIFESPIGKLHYSNVHM